MWSGTAIFPLQKVKKTSYFCVHNIRFYENEIFVFHDAGDVCGVFHVGFAGHGRAAA